MTPWLPVRTFEEDNLAKAEEKASKNTSWSSANVWINGAVLGSRGISASILKTPRPFIEFTKYWLSNDNVVGSFTIKLEFGVNDLNGQLIFKKISNCGSILSTSCLYKRLSRLKQWVTPKVWAPEIKIRPMLNVYGWKQETRNVMSIKITYLEHL